jgi:hypothetical protein
MWTPGKHTKDAFVDFKDEGHKYNIDWDQDGNWRANDISVTGLIKLYFPQFNADKILGGMGDEEHKQQPVKSKKPFWARSKEYRGKSKSQIKAMWTKNGLDARNAGSRLHKSIENYYLARCTRHNDAYDAITPTPPISSPEWFQFIDYATNSKYIPFHTEWVVYSDEYHGIVGTIDMMYVKECEGDKLTLIIVDWKRTKKISMWSPDTGTGPCHKIPNSNFFKYSLQLNTYKYIIENFYGGIEYNGKTYDEVDISSMYIVVFHPRLKKFARFKCPNMQHVVREMFMLRRASLNIKKK